VTTPLLGGAFDPPHNGHVALAAAVRERFGEPVVLVTEDPGHKATVASAADRLRLANAAFPGYRVELDPNARTVDLLRSGRFAEPLVVIGADEYRDLPGWKEPDEVRRLARRRRDPPGLPGRGRRRALRDRAPADRLQRAPRPGRRRRADRRVRPRRRRRADPRIGVVRRNPRLQ